ncbi:MAG: DUF3006 domain-containing protein [Elusimicrobiota bacterium]
MRAVIDRIEDGETVVIEVENGGKMLIPVEQFDIDVYEGACLDINFELNSEREEQKRKEISNLQEKLKKRTKEKHQKEENN